MKNSLLLILACDLIQLVNDETSAAHDFKVYGVDLYPILAYSNEQEGFGNAFTEYVGTKASDNSNLIICVAHQIDGSLSYEVVINFPDDGEYFSLLTEIEKEAITADVLNTMRAQAATDSGNSFLNPTVQIAGIDVLFGYFERLINGDELFDGQDVFELAGFEKVSLSLDESYSDDGVDTDENNTDQVDSKGNYIYDYVGVKINENTLIRDIISMNFNLGNNLVDNLKFKYIISDYNSYLGSGDLMQEKFESSLGDFAIWFHFGEEEDQPTLLASNNATYNVVYIKRMDNLSADQTEDIANFFYEEEMKKWIPELYDLPPSSSGDCSFSANFGKNCLLPEVCETAESTNGCWFGSDGTIGDQRFAAGLAIGMLDGLMGDLTFFGTAAMSISEKLNNVFSFGFEAFVDSFRFSFSSFEVKKNIALKYAHLSAEKIEEFYDNISSAYESIEQVYYSGGISFSNFGGVLEQITEGFIGWVKGSILQSVAKDSGYEVGKIAYIFVSLVFPASPGKFKLLGGGGKLLSSGPEGASAITALLKSTDEAVGRIADVTKRSKAKAAKTQTEIFSKGCFVEDTPVLMFNPHSKHSNGNAINSKSIDSEVNIKLPIQEVKLLDYTVSHKTVNAAYGMTVNKNDDYLLGLTQDPYTSDQQRARDKYEINNVDWNEVIFEEVHGSSIAKLALHNDWIKKKGYRLGALINLDLPEQGLSGKFKIKSIKHILPQKKPKDKNEVDEFAYSPITGIFVHESLDVWKLELSDGNDLKVTFAHPIYSVDLGDWRMAGALKKGEAILTKSGEVTILVKKSKIKGTHKVYNLEVKHLHNFLVGESEVVVHNTCKKSNVKKADPDGRPVTDSTPKPGSSSEKVKEATEDLYERTPSQREDFLNAFKENVPLILGASIVQLFFEKINNNCTKELFENIGDRPNFKVALLQDLSKSELEIFCDDFRNASSITYGKFEEKPGMVKAWKIAKNYSLTIRTDLDVLAKFVYIREKTEVWLNETQITDYENTLANNNITFNRIVNAIASSNSYYTLEEALEWEILIWKVQQEGVPLPNQPNLDRLRRFYLHLIGTNSNHSRTSSIALGLSNGNPALPGLLGVQPSNTTNFTLFQSNGFTNFNTGLSSPPTIWSAGLIESMWECFQHNGKIYFLLDGMNVNALNNPNITGFNSSTTKELRFIIKNNIDQLTVNNNGISSSLVEFWISGNKVPSNHQIFNAIDSYRNNPHGGGQVISGPAKPEIPWN